MDKRAGSLPSFTDDHQFKEYFKLYNRYELFPKKKDKAGNNYWFKYYNYRDKATHKYYSVSSALQIDPLTQNTDFLDALNSSKVFSPEIFVELTKRFIRGLSETLEDLEDDLNFQYDAFTDRKGFLRYIEFFVNELPKEWMPSQKVREMIREWIDKKHIRNQRITALNEQPTLTLKWKGKSPGKELRFLWTSLKNNQFIEEAVKEDEFCKAFGFGEYQGNPKIKWLEKHKLFMYMLNRLMENDRFIHSTSHYEKIINTSSIFVKANGKAFKGKELSNARSSVKKMTPNNSEIIDSIIEKLINL